ncbi:MAG TPA: twin-arginine translocation signal domain-containing protein [Roseiflexaceae bacterium]|nr:twin-arginine translocation signal domain-containing protein [Roseiflexaceae bacterium]
MSTRRNQVFGRERRRFLKGVAGIGAGAAIVLVAGRQDAQPAAAAVPAPRRAAVASQIMPRGWQLTDGAFDTASGRPVRLAYSVTF